MAYDGMGYRSVEDCEAEIRRLRERLAKVEASARREFSRLKAELEAVEASEKRLAEACEMLIEEILTPSSDPEEPIMKANRALGVRPDGSGG